MSDFETKLRWLSETGNTVGPEELIERIKADLAEDPLVVVAKRREGTTMSKTESPPTGQPHRYRGPAWAVAAFVVILTVGGLSFALSGGDGQVTDQNPVSDPATVPTPAPNPTLLAEVDEAPMLLDPGVYFADADGDPLTTTGATFLIEGPGWKGVDSGIYRQKFDGGVHLFVSQVDAPYPPLCDLTGGAPMPAGSTAADLADRFAAGGLTVREAPAPVSAFGHDGHHVAIEVPDSCDSAVGWEWNIFLQQGDVVEAWIFDIDGRIVLVEAHWRTESPERDLTELRAVIDTLVLTP